MPQLQSAGLLISLAHESSIRYLRGDQAKRDLVEMRDVIDRSLQDDTQMRTREEKQLLEQGLPPPDYLDKACDSVGASIVTDVRPMISRLSRAAAKCGFDIPQPFKGDTLEEALGGHIRLQYGSARQDAFARAVRESLRLLGDAVAHVEANDPIVVHDFSQLFSIVDVPDSGSARGDSLQELLECSFGASRLGHRGGTLMGSEGLGKSHLLQNVVLGN